MAQRNKNVMQLTFKLNCRAQALVIGMSSGGSTCASKEVMSSSISIVHFSNLHILFIANLIGK